MIFLERKIHIYGEWNTEYAGGEAHLFPLRIGEIFYYYYLHVPAAKLILCLP